MQYNNPYNLYVNNDHQTPNVATAPPLDDVIYTHQIHTHQIHTHQIPQNSFQEPYPTHIYPNDPYIMHGEQYNQQIQVRKNQEDDCCCLGLMTLLCCCLF